MEREENQKKKKKEESVSWIALLGCALYAIDNGIVFVSLIFFVIVFLLDESDVPSSVVKADFLKAVRKAVSKRLIRLLKGCYM